MKNQFKILSIVVMLITGITILVTSYLAILNKTVLFTIINPYLAIVAPSIVVLIGTFIFDRRNHVFSIDVENSVEMENA
jgi:hypothetical protein